VNFPFADLPEQLSVAEIVFSPTETMTKKENAKKEHERSKNWRSERENCLAYSRHLCVATRSTDVMGSKRPSTSSSTDSVFTSPLAKAGYGPYDYFRGRNLTLHRQVSVQGKVQDEVYKRDMKFHRKFGTIPVILEKYSLAAAPPHSSRIAGQDNSNSVCCSMDESASSFGDSVSIACSSINHVEKQEKWIKDACELSDKITKFDAIEKWLQGLPKPVFKTGSEHL